MKPIATTGSIVLMNALAAAFIPAAARADEFLAMPGLWQTTYEVDGTGAVANGHEANDHGANENRGGEHRVAWHCVDEAADPWVAFAQLRDLPGMTCKTGSQERNSTSLKWQAQCHGPGPEGVADVIEVAGAVSFDSPQHYRGWVKFSGTLLGYPFQSSTKLEGSRKAACTSPAD
jgi:hypothetical protein